MPQKKSAYKRLRQDKKKHLSNKSKISEIRTLTKKVRTLIGSKDKKEAEVALRELESRMDKAAKTNTMRENTVSRRISRLRKQLDLVGEKTK